MEEEGELEVVGEEEELEGCGGRRGSWRFVGRRKEKVVGEGREGGAVERKGS